MALTVFSGYKNEIDVIWFWTTKHIAHGIIIIH